MNDVNDKPAAQQGWQGAEEWMPLAWGLCANECGEEACTELVWEGGPIPEPWGDRWLKYEDQAKEMIAMVRKSLQAVAACYACNAATWEQRDRSAISATDYARLSSPRLSMALGLEVVEAKESAPRLGARRCFDPR